jgi:tetratricopeptide (TPR) repeat protein
MGACALIADPARTARAQLLRGQVRLARARYTDAAEDFAAVQAVARAGGDTGLEGVAVESLGWCAYHARDIERAVTLAERAVRHPASGNGARVLAGRLRHARGDLAGAVSMLEPVVEEDADPRASAAALSYLGSALEHLDRYSDAIAILDDAVERCRLGGLMRPMFNALFFRATARANLGDLSGALDAAQHLADEVERYGHDAYRPRAGNLLSWLWRELGEPKRSVDLALAALDDAHLADGYIEAEPAGHSRLQLAESALLLGDHAGAAAWLDELSISGPGGVGFGWRVELQRLEIRSGLDPSRGEELLAQATRYGSAKYRALGLAHLGRFDEALAVATSTGSDLLVARAGPEPAALAAAERIAARLRVEQRAGFLERGVWRRGVARR